MAAEGLLAWPLGLQTGDVSALALFALGLAIMLWPLARRWAEAHRQRVHESRIAGGQLSELRK